MPTFTVKITDKGAKKTVQAVFGSRDSSVKVGVFGDAGQVQEGTITVAELAAIHEFGLGVPERSFIRSYFDDHGQELGTLMLRLMKKAVLDAIRTGEPITDQIKSNILTKVGLVAVGGIQQRIGNGQIVPPLAQSTIDRKGSSTPLIDTGQLRASITHKVEL